jgi:hypothetical protein
MGIALFYFTFIQPTSLALLPWDTLHTVWCWRPLIVIHSHFQPYIIQTSGDLVQQMVLYIYKALSVPRECNESMFAHMPSMVWFIVNMNSRILHSVCPVTLSCRDTRQHEMALGLRWSYLRRLLVTIGIRLFLGRRHCAAGRLSNTTEHAGIDRCHSRLSRCEPEGLRRVLLQGVFTVPCRHRGAHYRSEGTVLQSGRSWVRDPMRWMHFLNLLNPSSRTRPWDLLSL